MALHESVHHEREHDKSADSGETRQVFGRYLLFKLLKRDALGETHRAGQLGSSAIERIVSLRLFNGAGVDGERFWQACQSRLELQSTLSGGPFGEVADCGYEGGVCYVAHEYVFGRSLAELLDQSRVTSCPVPIEQALHIMDRIAISLHNAYGKRLDGKRVTHGTLIPAFAHLSSEGEVHLTAFESAGGILDLPLDGAVHTQLAGYCSPEINAGQPPTAADDVYSMGAIFYELLTGEALPPIIESGASQWIDAGVVAAEAAPLPEDIRQLLRTTLVPRDQRIQSAEKWHRELSGIISTGEYSPTTFNLAFFMHTLFGDELDREAQIVEAERLEQLPSQPAPAPIQDDPPVVATPEPAAMATDEQEASVEIETPEPQSEAEIFELPPRDSGASDGEPTEPALDLASESAYLQEPEGLAEATVEASVSSAAEARTQAAPDTDSRRRLFGIVAIVAVIGALALAFLVFDLPLPGTGGDAPQPLTVAAAPRLDEVAAFEPTQTASESISGEMSDVTPPLSPDELETQVRSLVAERAGNMEASLKAEYDQRLVALRGQLEQARQASAAEAEAEAEPTESTQVASPPPASPPVSPPAEPVAQRRTTPQPVATTAQNPPQTSEVARQVESEEPQTPSAGEPDAAPIPSELPPAEPSAAITAPAREVVAEPVAAPLTERPKPVERGSLVERGSSGVTPPSLVKQTKAVYPPAAVRLKKEASVRLRILVDEQGRPSEIEQVGKKVGMGFDQAAMRAAKGTLWTPPTKDGVEVKMWVELSVDFRP